MFEISPRVRKFLIWLCAIAVVFGVIVRAYKFYLPQKTVFDEVYFPVFAYKLLHGELVFDVHPPFGKMLMAIGIAIFGNNQTGWRIVPLLFGIGLIWLFARLWRDYFQDYFVRRSTDEDNEYLEELRPVQKDLALGSWLIAALIAIECFFIEYSRVGLMDGVLLFFILATFLVAQRVGESWKRMAWVAILFGLACSIKWLALALIVPLAFQFWRRKQFWRFMKWMPLSLLVYLGVVMSFAIYHHHANPVGEMLLWHYQTWDYQVTLKATHPWGSVWWTWPIMKRPLLMFYESTASGAIQVISAIGNPIIWYSSTLVVIWSLLYLLWRWFFKLKPIIDHPLTPLLIGYFAFWLPWALITRVLFIYHYFPAYSFALLILNYWLVRLWNRAPRLVIAILIVFFGFSIFYLPMVTGWAISQKYLSAHIWLKSWL